MVPMGFGSGAVDPAVEGRSIALQQEAGCGPVPSMDGPGRVGFSEMSIAQKRDGVGHLDLRLLNPTEMFLSRLKEERNRSDRNGKPFSVLLVRVGEDQQGWGRETAFLIKALERFAESVRLSDVMGWYSTTEMGILLPETSEEEAMVVLQRLKGFLRGLERCPLGELGREDGRFRILEYPKTLEEKLRENGGLPGRPSNAEFEHRACGFSEDWGFLRDTSPCRRTRRDSLVRVLDKWARDCLDFAAASLGLVVLAPVMLGIAVCIKLTSPGPVLFRQKRIGKDGKEFTFLKFRTMYHNCDQEIHKQYVTRLIENRAEKYEAKGGSYFKLVNDPRVTPVGRFLRITSLDELPQLFNVLKGEMSLVGPRPPIPYEVERYKGWQLRRVLEAKPGITGLWQVSGRSRTTFDEQVRLDLRYVERQSLWMNLRIILRTFKAVFSAKGAW